MSVEKEKVCRGCLLVSTAELSQTHYETLSSFTAICGLTISNESNLPNRLCKNCLRLLNQCQQFIINCQKASKVLTELLKKNQDGKFKIEELYNKRSKQIYETYPLELAQLSTIKCSQRNNIFNSSINSSQNSIFTSAAKLNLNDSEKRLNGDVDQFTQHPTTGSTEIKDIEWNQVLRSVDDFNNGPPPLVFFDSDDERHKIDCLPIKKELEHVYECFDSPASIDIKEEIINVTNETLVEDLLANRKGSDLKKKCFKLKINQKNKKSNIRCIAIDKLKGKLNEKVDKARVGADERTKRKHRVSNYSFDKSAVNVNKLSYQEQLCALETARNRVEYLEAPFKCKPCAKYFVHELSMQGHMKRHDESAGKYICKICTQRYSSLRNLQSHDAIHRERLQCKQCLQVLCGRVSMAKHIAHAHNGYIYATFECDICGKVATSKHNLRRHMLTHSTSKDNKCKCPYCPKTFSLSTSRNDHATRAHSKGERYFPCKICKRSFLNKTLLRLHAITHSDKKDFYCVECDMHFKRKKLSRSSFENIHATR